MGGHSGPSLQRHGSPEDISVGHPSLGALEGAWQTHLLTLVCDTFSFSFQRIQLLFLIHIFHAILSNMLVIIFV